MNYPTQPERLTTRTLTPDEQRDHLKRRLENATTFIVGGEQLKTGRDERLSAPMTWTDTTPTTAGIYLYLTPSAANSTAPLDWVQLAEVRPSDEDGVLMVTTETVWEEARDMNGWWLKIEPPGVTVTASKTAPSPAGSWRKAGGVLSKSQGQQQ